MEGVEGLLSGVIVGGGNSAQSVVHYQSLHARVMGEQVLGGSVAIIVAYQSASMQVQVAYQSSQWNTRGSIDRRSESHTQMSRNTMKHNAMQWNTNVTQCNETPLRIPSSISLMKPSQQCHGWAVSGDLQLAICTVYTTCNETQERAFTADDCWVGTFGGSLMWMGEQNLLWKSKLWEDWNKVLKWYKHTVERLYSAYK